MFILKTAVAGLVAVAGALPAWAEEYPMEMKGCLVSETQIIDKAGDVVIGTSIVRGSVDHVGPGPFPAKTTHDCRVVFTRSKAGSEFTNRCNFVDADGDRVISVASGSYKAFEWKWIAGTGKFEGIAGSGTAKTDVAYPVVAPNLAASCWSGKGTYAMRK